MKQIYILWWAPDEDTPMAPACITTSEKRLKDALEDFIHDQRISYIPSSYDWGVGLDEGNHPQAREVRALREHWSKLSREEINAALVNGRIETVLDGAIL